LFGIPVIDTDEQEDFDVRYVVCNLDKNPGRLELLEHASMIIWDESLSNHMHCLDAAARLLNNFENKVLLLMGDCAQTPPVVKYGSDEDIFEAHMFRSRLWSHFDEYNFNINLRLSGLSVIEHELQPQQLAQFLQEKNYSNMIVKIAKAESCDQAKIISTDKTRVSLVHVWMPTIKYITEQTKVIEFLYPQGFNYESMQSATILCATNNRVDYWNSVIQTLNKNEEPVELYSADEFCEVDDKHNHLKDMISDYVLQAYEKHGVPPHNLTLKVGDICMLMRTLSRKDKLCNNSRVVIKSISRFRIRVQLLLPGTPVYFDIPRIRFIFTLRFGRGFKMMRTQFPLRLAYYMTINKSQGQTTNRTALDTFDQPFTHGQLYVAMSRVSHSQHMCIHCKEDQIITINDQSGPVVHNVVIKKLIQNF